MVLALAEVAGTHLRHSASFPTSPRSHATPFQVSENACGNTRQEHNPHDAIHSVVPAAT